MNIIPVIDLMQGVVVHAQRGDRSQYRAIAAAQYASSHAEDIVRVWTELYRFDCLYIADLDAIMGGPPQSAHIQHLHQAFPALTLLVDAGLYDEDSLLTAPPYLIPVIGTESLTQSGQLQQLSQQFRAHQREWILSLDFRAGQLLGCADMTEVAQAWPKQVIAMNLSQVGSLAGPDWALLKQLLAQYPTQQWIAAGGVRDDDDIAALQAHGIHSVLVASALHQGKLQQIQRPG